MEELTEDGDTYSQTKILSENSGCMGCVFDDIEDGCMAGLKFYNLCTINKTIWIKKEKEMEEYTDKNGIVYKQKPEDGKTCIGCAFNNHGSGYECGASQVIKACGTGEIIWVKKELEMSTEVTKDFIEPKYLPKAGIKYDQEKPRYSLLPPTALEEVVNVLTFGSKKYEDFNWMHLENPNDRFFSAASRHMWAWQKGEKLDSENGYNHLAAAVSNLLFILELELLKNKVPTKD